MARNGCPETSKITPIIEEFGYDKSGLIERLNNICGGDYTRLAPQELNEIIQSIDFEKDLTDFFPGTRKIKKEDGEIVVEEQGDFWWLSYGKILKAETEDYDTSEATNRFHAEKILKLINEKIIPRYEKKINDNKKDRIIYVNNAFVTLEAIKIMKEHLINVDEKLGEEFEKLKNRY